MTTQPIITKLKNTGSFAPYPLTTTSKRATIDVLTKYYI